MTEPQDIGDDRTARGTSRTARNALLDREPHEVPHDQEVAGVTHLLDDAQFVLHPRPMHVGDVVGPVAVDHPVLAQFAQIVDVLLALGRLEDRVVPRLQIELNIDTVGNLLRPRDGMFEAGEDGVHLFGRADEELIGIHLHPLGVGSLDLCVHAQQHIVHRGIGLIEVVRIVRRHQRQSHPVRKVHCHVHALFLDGEARVLNLHVQPVAKHAAVPRRQFLGLVHLPLQQHLRQLARRAAGQQDDPLAVCFQQFLVDARLVIKALQERRRRQLDEVLKPNAVHRQQRQVIAGLFDARRPGLVKPRTGSDVRLQTQHRIDALVSALVVELERPIQIAVIRDGEGIHPRPLDLLHDLIDPVCSVEQAVVRVTVQVSERLRCDSGIRHRSGIRHDSESLPQRMRDEYERGWFTTENTART